MPITFTLPADIETATVYVNGELRVRLKRIGDQVEYTIAGGKGGKGNTMVAANTSTGKGGSGNAA